MFARVLDETWASGVDREAAVRIYNVIWSIMTTAAALSAPDARVGPSVSLNTSEDLYSTIVLVGVNFDNDSHLTI